MEMDRERACTFRSIIIPDPESWKTWQTPKKNERETFIFILRKTNVSSEKMTHYANLKTVNPYVVGDGVEAVSEVVGAAVGASVGTAKGAAVGIIEEIVGRVSLGAVVGAVRTEQQSTLP